MWMGHQCLFLFPHPSSIVSNKVAIKTTLMFFRLTNVRWSVSWWGILHWFWGASHQWTISPKASFFNMKGIWMVPFFTWIQRNQASQWSNSSKKSMEWRAIPLHANNSITHPLTHFKKKIHSRGNNCCVYCLSCSKFLVEYY